MNKFILSLVLVSCLCQFGYAQKKKAWVKAADEAYEIEKDYYKAFKYYETALLYRRDTSDVLRLLFRQGESARQINAYFDARDAFLEFTRRAPADSLRQPAYQCVWAYLGQLQLNVAYSGLEALNPEGYRMAEQYFDRAEAAGGSCGDIVAEGRAIIAFATQERQRINESVNVNNLGPNINSPMSDFAPMPLGESLYFTSYRNEIREKGVKPQRYYSRIYRSSNGAAADTLANINPKPKDTLHIGHTAFNSDRTKIYYTQCRFEGKTLNTTCQLWVDDLQTGGIPAGNGRPVAELNRAFAGFTITQPALTTDPASGREVLYFVSDRTGTRGGTDIWRSELVDGQFTAATNDLVINTDGNEMTPFAQGNVFYFSSNGLPDRYGGYDIFTTPNPATTPPINLGQKINSSADELYYSLNAEGDRAYFASNRLASTMFERSEENEDELKEACCLDIYAHKPEPPCLLEVSTFSDCCTVEGQNQRQALAGATVTLLDITEGEDRAQTIAPTSQDGHVYRFNGILQAFRKYRIVGSFPGLDDQVKELDFTNGSIPCAGGGVEQADLCFTCKPAVTVQVNYNNQPVQGARVRIVDITDRPQFQPREAPAMEEAAVNVQAMRGQDIECPPQLVNYYETIPGEVSIRAGEEFQIDFGRTYLIIADSDRDDLLLNTTTYRADANDPAFCGLTCLENITVELEALPTAEVFFDNASPKWRGWRTGGGNRDIADSTYLQTQQAYLEKENRYLGYFASGSEQDFTQTSELNQFFNNELNPSTDNLYAVAKKAKELMCLGIPIVIEANGCASPKFNVREDNRQANFNNALINRRVNSVLQDLQSFGLDEGETAEFFNYQQVSNDCGRAQRDPSVKPEDLQNQRNKRLSVFSIDAAVARRVEIALKIRK